MYLPDNVRYKQCCKMLQIHQKDKFPLGPMYNNNEWSVCIYVYIYIYIHVLHIIYFGTISKVFVSMVWFCEVALVSSTCKKQTETTLVPDVPTLCIDNTCYQRAWPYLYHRTSPFSKHSCSNPLYRAWNKWWHIHRHPSRPSSWSRSDDPEVYNQY